MAPEWMQPQRVPYWGVDRRLDDRPGVPRETAPHPLPNSHWARPEQQTTTLVVLKRADLAQLTPVFGTAQPPRGLSGTLRRIAYRIPDHLARHWILLIVADRVDVAEGRIARLARLWPFRAVGAVVSRLRSAWRALRG